MADVAIPEAKPESPLPGWLAAIPVIGDLIAVVVAIFTHEDGRLFETDLVYCTYYRIDMQLPPGKKAKIEIDDNQSPATGAVQIFFFPPPIVWPPAQPPAGSPRITFGGNGSTTIEGPGYLVFHLNTDKQGLKPHIRVRYL